MTTLKPSVKDKAIAGGKVAHVGQLYFEQALNDAVQQKPPYNTNKQFLMRNKDDFLLMQGSAGVADPIVEYTLLGKDVGEGVYAWMNFAIDPKADRKVRAVGNCSAGKDCKPTVFDWLTEATTFWNTIMSYQWKPLTSEQGAGKPGVVKRQTPATASPPAKAPEFPNTEGALIGAGLAGLGGGLIGGLVGMFTNWNFADLQKELAKYMNMTTGQIADKFWPEAPAIAPIPSYYFDGLAYMGSQMGFFGSASASSSSSAAATPPPASTGTITTKPEAAVVPTQNPLASIPVPGVAPTAKAPSGPANGLLGTEPKAAPPAISPAPKGVASSIV
jgi:hypothetical protein